ncbi:hypothetical protein B4N84_11360 [Flavobacterium sp. IR1]|nr:hypothetical protein B4N84_11360 [Flavobacterium sp. IR1]
MKFSMYLFLLVLTFSCTSRHDLKNVNSIFEKLTVFPEDNGSYSENKIIVIDNENFVIEEKIIYDSEGKCSYLYAGSAEGLIPHSRDNEKGFLPLEKEQLDYNIKIDKKNNWILDNNDTIRVFKVLKNEIVVNIDSTNRVLVYKYK